jgi:hypothetical protein
VRFDLITTAAALAACCAGPATAAKLPANGPYTFTGTATILSGPSDCIGTSPAPVTGDAIVSSKGQTFLLHIKSSTAVAATGIVFSANHQVIVRYGVQVNGTTSYVLLPKTTARSGRFAALAAAGTGASFTDMITLDSAPLLVGKTGSCQIGLALTLTPGINKALLKLLSGVL